MVWNKKIFEKEEIAKIKSLYLNGKILKEISKIFKCSLSPICRTLRENNIPSRKHRLHSEETKRKIKEQLKKVFPNGKPSNSGSFKKGLTPWNKGKKLGEPSNKIRFSVEQKKIIVNLFVEKLKSVQEIGKYFHCTDRPIYRVLKENNIEPNQGNRMRLKYSGEKSFSYKKLDNERILELYSQGISAYKIGKLFGVKKGTILSRLKEKGTEIRASGFRNRDFITTKDGHLVKSSPELEIDNFLFNNNLQHIYNGNIADTKYRYDFYLPEFNVYIEYFGVEDNYYYSLKTKIKIELYLKLGLNLLSIYPKDNLQEKLNIILEAKKRGIKEIKFI